MNAYEQGLEWGSCEAALKRRKALGKDATQADWWRACDRGDWLMWQLWHIQSEQYEEAWPAIRRAVDRIINGACQRYDVGKMTVVKCDFATVEADEFWSIRMQASAHTRVSSVVRDLSNRYKSRTARLKELRRQAHEIHREIPEWPGGKNNGRFDQR